MTVAEQAVGKWFCLAKCDWRIVKFLMALECSVESLSHSTQTLENTHSYVCNELSDKVISSCSVMNWTSLCVKRKERRSMMISECQCYITMCVYVCEKSLCLMKFGGDLEISPICGILWSSISHLSLSLSFSPPQIWSWERLVQLRCLCTGENAQGVLLLSEMLKSVCRICSFYKNLETPRSLDLSLCYVCLLGLKR